MPTYEYACTSCGNEFERFESITAKANKSCPKCNKKKAERRISGGGGFIFKGTGFYLTDYKKSTSGGKSETKKSEAAPAATGGCGGGCACHSASATTKAKASK